jgi:hypothetical protein
LGNWDDFRGEAENRVFENGEVKMRHLRNWALTVRDVRNEATSGDMYENKGEWTKCLAKKTPSCTKIRQLSENRQQSSGLFGGNAQVTPQIVANVDQTASHPIIFPAPCSARLVHLRYRYPERLFAPSDVSFQRERLAPSAHKRQKGE